jgi:hypothetical protein
MLAPRKYLHELILNGTEFPNLLCNDPQGQDLALAHGKIFFKTVLK